MEGSEDQPVNLVEPQIDKYALRLEKEKASLKAFIDKVRSGKITPEEEDQFIHTQAQKVVGLERQNEELLYDPLLEGFLIRRPFNQRLEQVIKDVNNNQAKPRKPGESFKGAVLVEFDLDNFRDANSIGGHPFGDEVLKHVAKIIREHVRRSKDIFGRPNEEQDKEPGTTGRPGGDEIAAILYDTDRFGATKVVEAIREELMDTPVKTPSGQSWYQTVSIGLAFIEPGQNLTAEEVTKRADIAAYKAKGGGKNQSVIYQEGMTKKI